MAEGNVIGGVCKPKYCIRSAAALVGLPWAIGRDEVPSTFAHRRGPIISNGFPFNFKSSNAYHPYGFLRNRQLFRHRGCILFPFFTSGFNACCRRYLLKCFGRSLVSAVRSMAFGNVVGPTVAREPSGQIHIDNGKK